MEYSQEMTRLEGSATEPGYSPANGLAILQVLPARIVHLQLHKCLIRSDFRVMHQSANAEQKDGGEIYGLRGSCVQ